MGTLHRLPSRNRAAQAPLDDDADVALTGPLSLLWIASVVRVVAAVRAQEVFGADASLALLALFAIPWLAARALRPAGARRHASHENAKFVRLSRRHAGVKRDACAR